MFLLLISTPQRKKEREGWRKEGRKKQERKGWMEEGREEGRDESSSSGYF